MSPRALTEPEKAQQKQRLMKKAEELVLAHGIGKVSVDDIVKAAGMAKGTFYNYFTSKEDLLMQLVWVFYQKLLSEAEVAIKTSRPDGIRASVDTIIRAILTQPDKVFFFNNHAELELLIASVDRQEIKNINDMEQKAFAHLITLAGKDTTLVKPGVVHNYLHAMYFAVSDEAMAQEYMEETIDAMLAGMLHYIFGPANTQGQ